MAPFGDAVGLVARSELRSRWRALLGLALLVAFVGAVSLAGFAGARRTASALDRFEAATLARDVRVVGVDDETTHELAEDLEDQPWVTAVGEFVDFSVNPDEAVAPVVGSVTGDLLLERLCRGRRPVRQRGRPAAGPRRPHALRRRPRRDRHRRGHPGDARPRGGRRDPGDHVRRRRPRLLRQQRVPLPGSARAGGRPRSRRGRAGRGRLRRLRGPDAHRHGVRRVHRRVSGRDRLVPVRGGRPPPG